MNRYEIESRLIELESRARDSVAVLPNESRVKSIVTWGDATATKRSFDVTSNYENVLTIRRGGARFIGGPGAIIPQSTAVITGSAETPTWVYVQRVVSTNTYSIETTDLPDGPQSTGELWTWPLYTYYLDATTGVVTLDQDWRDDISMGSPLV